MLQTDVIFLNHYWADSADLEIAESLQITIRKVDMNSSWLKWMSRPFPLKLKEWNGSLYLQLCRIWAWQFSYLTLYCFGDIGKRKIFYQSCCIILHPKLGLQSSSSCLSMLWGGQNVCIIFMRSYRHSVCCTEFIKEWTRLDRKKEIKFKIFWKICYFYYVPDVLEQS